MLKKQWGIKRLLEISKCVQNLFPGLGDNYVLLSRLGAGSGEDGSEGPISGSLADRFNLPD
jgi:hypothetical protein